MGCRLACTAGICCRSTCPANIAAHSTAELHPPTRFEAQRLLQVWRRDGIERALSILVKALQRGAASPAGARQRRRNDQRKGIRDGGLAHRLQSRSHVAALLKSAQSHRHGTAAPKDPHHKEQRHAVLRQQQRLTGMGMRRSWLTMPVDTNTSAMAAPRDRKPPAVPAPWKRKPWRAAKPASEGSATASGKAPAQSPTSKSRHPSQHNTAFDCKRMQAKRTCADHNVGLEGLDGKVCGQRCGHRAHIVHTSGLALACGQAGTGSLGSCAFEQEVRQRLAREAGNGVRQRGRAGAAAAAAAALGSAPASSFHVHNARRL